MVLDTARPEGAMTGERFIKSLQDGREVFLDGKQISDVTSHPAFAPMIEELAAILTGFPNPLQVEGFTDDIPIKTATFPSNWELSAARAASVVALLADFGVAPHRMAAVGFGEHRPIADNSTPEGRSRNRRVVLVIPAEQQALRQLELGRLSGESSAASLNTVQPWAEAPAVETPNG